ncbi:UNVERIFIED_CONTAM: hypothetical protein PYX00_004653 [Menopon gallinae]|uniref:Calponin-homology (CH) domain-containing protein n=1 Tax=Menopon gallinae TaxID=328185 RepID=A0AAW2I643_9NEOP
MSTQSYYRDRLGFDQNEWNDGLNTPVYEANLTKSKGLWEFFIEATSDERDAIQKKTFTKWVNKHLKKHWKYMKNYTCLHVCVTNPQFGPCCSPTAGRHVNDLFEDLQDGHNLISLLEVLSQENLPRERGSLRFHMLHNVQTCLDFLRYKKIKLVNIRAEDIVDGNPKLTLGLIWTIILHFQVSVTTLSAPGAAGVEGNFQDGEIPRGRGGGGKGGFSCKSKLVLILTRDPRREFRCLR